MTEVVLQYDRSIVPQETFYWCAPASCQVVLNARGINITEQQLATELGTHTGGTDHIGLVTPVLNRHLGPGYVTRIMPNDPPTVTERQLLWDDIRASINAGFGLVVNIVAPPSNYPIGVKGSASPAYSGGVVYHYCSILGYDNNHPGGAVWVADSGFRPYGYWCSLEQMAGLIVPKGYAAKPIGDLSIAPEDDPLWADVLTQMVGPR